MYSSCCTGDSRTYSSYNWKSDILTTISSSSQPGPGNYLSTLRFLFILHIYWENAVCVCLWLLSLSIMPARPMLVHLSWFPSSTRILLCDSPCVCMYWCCVSLLRLEVLGYSYSLVCGCPLVICTIMAPGVVETSSAKMDWIPGSRGRGLSSSLKLRKLMSHQGLLEQADTRASWDPGFTASSGRLKWEVLSGSAGPVWARVRQGPALTGSFYDPGGKLLCYIYLIFSPFFNLITFTVVDISKTILPLSFSCLFYSSVFHHNPLAVVLCFFLCPFVSAPLLSSSPSHRQLSSPSPLLQPGWPHPKYLAGGGLGKDFHAILPVWLSEPRAQL